MFFHGQRAVKPLKKTCNHYASIAIAERERVADAQPYGQVRSASLRWDCAKAQPLTSTLGIANPSAAVAPLRPQFAVINYELSASTALEGSVSTNLEVLEAEVLQLPPVERSHLLERLIASLDSDPEVEEAWEREADRREAELESGSISTISGQEAIARLRARLTR